MKFNFDRLQKRRYIRRRKNLYKIWEFLNIAITENHYKPGEVVRSDFVWACMEDSGYSNMFQRDDSGIRGDEFGPVRSIGDLLGRHGLRLTRVGNKRYKLPNSLPVVNKYNELTQEAVYE